MTKRDSAAEPSERDWQEAQAVLDEMQSGYTYVDRVLSIYAHAIARARQRQHEETLEHTVGSLRRLDCPRESGWHERTWRLVKAAVISICRRIQAGPPPEREEE